MAQATSSHYIGGELDLFARAANWKRYVKKEIGKYIIGEVLEVGAGIGGTTRALHDGTARHWVCLEPDYGQAKQLRVVAKSQWGVNEPSVIVGSLHALVPRPSFDCILYMDVLEHIAEDRLQIEEAARLLRPGGHIVVLSPAHDWLFSEFDKGIGHLRRYNKESLRSLMPPGCTEQKLVYLDAVGLFLSLGNVLALKQAMPSHWQILTWDRFCVPLSRIVDRLLQGRFGKSILAVWVRSG